MAARSLVLAAALVLTASCGGGGDQPADAGPACVSDFDCDDGNDCTLDQCVDGACGYQSTLEDEICDDGLACTENTRCADGVCTGDPLDCSGLSDFCNTGSCSEAMGGCVVTPLADDTACDDGMFCTDADVCSAGVCGGTARDCSAMDDACNLGVCDETAGACVPAPANEGGGCDDGLYCTGTDQCTAGVCGGLTSTDCDDADACTTDTCDEDADDCVQTPVPPIPNAEGPPGDGTCSDGDDNDCDGAVDLADSSCLDCVVDGDCADGNSCTNDVCTTGVCSNPLRPNGASCNDFFCTLGDTCQSGLCTAGPNPNCVDGDGCTADLCDEGGDLCSNPSRTIDPTSPVSTSSDDGTPLTACVVAGSSGRVLVWVDLRDNASAPFTGATVTIGGMAATASTARPGTYWREVTAPATAGTTMLAVSATGCGDTENLPTVTLNTVAANATTGGTGGCTPADGNIRVRVLAAENGTPISGASILVGQAEGTPFHTGPEAFLGASAPTGTNVATTDAMGYAQFRDYGSALAGPITVTAGAANRAYFTVADGNASDLVLALPLTNPPAVATTVYGNTGTATLTGCNDFDAGIVLPKLQLDFFSSFDTTSLLEKNRCWASNNGLVGTVAIPENVWIPTQGVGPLCFGGTLDEAPWSLTLDNTASTGVTENLDMVVASAPVSDVQAVLSGGSLADLLIILSYRRIGFILNETVPTPPTGTRNINAAETYPNSFMVTYSGKPAETDIVGVTIADYAGTNGTGPLALLGTSVHEWDVTGSSVNIPNSDLNAAGTPQGVRRLAAVAAVYLDAAAHPSVASNRLDAVSTVLIRGGATAPFGSTGGSASVSNFLGLAGTTYTAPASFSWQNASANGNQPLYSVHELSVRTQTYLPVLSCETENEIRDSHAVQWIVVKPFATNCAPNECFTLPTLPASFPRAAVATQKRSGFAQKVGSGAPCTVTCPVSGEACVDPDGAGAAGLMCMGGAGSAGNPYVVQDYYWNLHAYDLELLPGFDFNAYAFSSRLPNVTHDSRNRQTFD